jgi:hypothetical protein
MFGILSYAQGDRRCWKVGRNDIFVECIKATLLTGCCSNKGKSTNGKIGPPRRQQKNN